MVECNSVFCICIKKMKPTDGTVSIFCKYISLQLHVNMTRTLYFQIYVCGVLSTVYSLLMIVLLIGLAIEAKQSDFCSISTFFFGFVIGVFFLAAILHPRVRGVTHYNYSNIRTIICIQVFLKVLQGLCRLFLYFLASH
jgi:Na+/H+-translocating membrane pyrophosphatase